MTRLGIYATGAAIGLTMLAAVVVYVTSAERAKRDLDTAKDYIEGTQDARDAPNSIPDDDDGLVEWLRSFAD